MKYRSAYKSVFDRDSTSPWKSWPQALCSRLVVGGAVLGLALSSCAVSPVPTDSAGQPPDAESLPSDGPPAVRLPAIRLSRRAAVPIASLAADRVEETVAVSGNVAQRVAVLDGWLYQVQDETGSVWVVTDRSEPTVGDVATVEGTVRYESIVVEGIDAGEVYLEETTYRPEDS